MNVGTTPRHADIDWEIGGAGRPGTRPSEFRSHPQELEVGKNVQAASPEKLTYGYLTVDRPKPRPRCSRSLVRVPGTSLSITSEAPGLWETRGTLLRAFVIPTARETGNQAWPTAKSQQEQGKKAGPGSRLL